MQPGFWLHINTSKCYLHSQVHRLIPTLGKSSHQGAIFVSKTWPDDGIFLTVIDISRRDADTLKRTIVSEGLLGSIRHKTKNNTYSNT